ncbi:hypothetical protein BO79DRAFT_257565 [Aspergillus costaricaensis CBS 115574]|uniref:Uncharacterized protein n=1 Tax=Aspergillus costaricaensis CBS 115574 TaxID=1448317 RepID=A0ACD1I661_9EURO|nr:hypothetical protein BO79DRAFT_257565 [Aspergillus costaricaensis CBS 115574]RAK86059.1 hypothetical protein BO79DRAFT_257565 [Aspergillus costaricaensis CBS 115574]
MAKGTRRPKLYMPVSMKFNSCIHCLRHVINNYRPAQRVPFGIGCQMDARASFYVASAPRIISYANQLSNKEDFPDYNQNSLVFLLQSTFLKHILDTDFLNERSTASADGFQFHATRRRTSALSAMFPSEHDTGSVCTIFDMSIPTMTAEAALYKTGYYIDNKASVLCHSSYGGKKTCEPVCWINAHHLVKIVE